MKALFRILVLSICLLTITITAAMAAPVGDDVKVTSEKMTYSADGQTVVFTGNVVVKHPEADMWANKVTVYLHNDKNAKKTETTGNEVNPGKIEKIVSEGNVVVKFRAKQLNDATGGEK
eukprot:TRINITY_DN6237_c0_g2_i1.p2 TRINITY_DN6237_c0_g2~~TRINITY_DN6237_c0_g2_i1.p2  ORF type:complete len:119 (+),score=6.47 TRINITY_DN6237_c0_g2_i1:119-475(+)